MNKVMITVAMLALSFSAIAHEGMHGPGSKHDADGSGALSVKEYTAYLKEEKQDVTTAAKKFAVRDTNKDGALSGAELLKGQLAKPK